MKRGGTQSILVSCAGSMEEELLPWDEEGPFHWRAGECLYPNGCHGVLAFSGLSVRMRGDDVLRLSECSGKFY